MSDTITPRTDRDDFQATRDPALMESADAGKVNLLTYRQLYELWERQQWKTQDLDFSQDRLDWQSFPEEERFQRMYGLSSFFIGEQRVEAELGPMMRAAPTEEMVREHSTRLGRHKIAELHEIAGDVTPADFPPV